jgi:hypothetical protein
VTAVTAVLALAVSALIGLHGSDWPDWSHEAQASVSALLDGHLATFLRSAPPYGGSLLMRAPFFALTRLWGGGEAAVYRLSALPCLAAAAALALWLAAELRHHGAGVMAQAATVAVCIAGPLVVITLQQGHPEELLGAVLCVAGVLCAQRDRPIWAGLLVGLAIANKEWGVIAVGPALVALAHHRLRAIAAMAAASLAVLAPFVLVRASGFLGQTEGVALHSAGIFNPWQLWWFLGSAAQDGTRTGPGWLAGFGHTLPVLVMPPLTLVYVACTRRDPGRRRRDALLLLALLLMLRCALDPWDTVYYPLPFLTALLAWEATDTIRPPFIALVGTLLTWFVFQGSIDVFAYRRDLFAVLFIAVTVPALCLVGRRLWAGSWPAPRVPGWLDATTLVALLLLVAGAWRGLDGRSWPDWSVEASPSVNALLSGHIGEFFRLAPAYGGSLLLRAPFMALSRLWGGGGAAVYRLGAAPCVAALGALAVWIGGEMRRRGCGATARMAAVVVCTAGPLSILALQSGHPEELLGAVLCVAAVLCAQRDRAIWSGILVGLAIANKEWGMLAAGPVLVALTHSRWRAIASMTTTAALLFAPFVLIHAGGFVVQTEAVAVHAGGLFSPFQLWWSLGSPIGAGARIGPSWLAGLGHTLPIAISLPLTIGYALRARHTPDRMRRDAMLLLALLLLLRCALDPWDAVYYPVPFLTALLAWETTSSDRPPFLAAIASLAGSFVCEVAPATPGWNQDMLATAFAIAVVPAIGAMGLRLLGPPTPRTGVTPALGRPRPAALRRG